ncbi:MAG: hypothetical protein II721_05400 [Bacilli bacterium]|nr:hypothetical protein [Bacilli bacterium]
MMKKKGILFVLSSALLFSCASLSPSVSSPSSEESKETSSKKEESSESSEVSSEKESSEETSKEESSSEEESEESQSSEQSISQESQTSEEEKAKLYLYDADSHLYCVDGVRKNNPYLKTYRLKDEEDVPYIDIDEFRNIYKNAYTDYKFRGFKKVDEGIYSLYSPMGGEVRFDCKAQKISINDVGKLNYDFGHQNGDVFNDVCLDWRFLKGSDKSKYIVPSKGVEIDLAKYNLRIIDHDGHLYVSLSLINFLIVRPNQRSICYNGRDYFADNLLGDAGLTRAYSGNKGACISIQKSKISRYHFDMVDKKDGESYHFLANGVATTFGKTTTCDLVMKNDGTCTLKTNDGDLMPTFDFKGNWEKDGEDFLSFSLSPTEEDSILSSFSETIDLSEKTYYRAEKRSASMAKAHYYDLCLDFDYLYGEKSFHKYSSADEFFALKGFKPNLLSLDNATYYDTLSKLLMGEDFGDSHVTLRNEGFASKDYKKNLGEYTSYSGKRLKDYQDAAKRVGTVRANFEGYQFSGETASMFLPNFGGAYKEGLSKAVLQNKYSGEEEGKYEKIGKAAFNDMMIGLGYFLNDIVKNPAIKNVVLDVSGNLGGYAMWIPYVMAIFTDDPYITFTNSIDNSIVETHYKADLDGDGVFGGEKDTFKGKYNFYVATAGASYSAGNIFPTMVKDSGIAKVIGEKTGGGCCGVFARTDLTGYLYQYSGNIAFPHKENNSFIIAEDGLEPDIKMDLETFTDIKKLDAALKELPK